MATHDDWKPLLTTFEEHHGSEVDAGALFREFCEGKGINPEEPRLKNAFGYDWSGTVLLEGDWKELAEEIGAVAEEGMFLVGGRAIHPCKTHHPNEWPEERIYLEAELALSAASAKGQPFWMDHAIPLGGKNTILGARYYDGELQYVGQVEAYLKNMIERGEIKHISPGFDWTILEKLNGVAPRGIQYKEFSLLKNLLPGDGSTTVELWEGLVQHCVEASAAKGEIVEAALWAEKALELGSKLHEAVGPSGTPYFEKFGELADNVQVVCPNCGYLSEKRLWFGSELHAGTCPICAHALEHNSLAESTQTAPRNEEMAEALGFTADEFEVLTWEEKFNAVATLFDGKLMEARSGMYGSLAGDNMVVCPKCGAANEKYNWQSWGASVGAAGACYICGYEVLPEEIVQFASAEELGITPWELGNVAIQQEAVKKLHKEIRALKIKFGEAVLSPVTGHLEILNYIRADAIEAIIPAQMHHRAQPGYQRTVRELRSLVRDSREVK